MARRRVQRSGRAHRRRRVSFSKQNLELEEINRHHTDIEESVRSYFSWGNAGAISRFVGYTREEVESELELTLAESERNSAMSILAALEATFRIDYLQRNYRRKRDVLSKELRDVYKTKGEYASLEDEVLPAWRRCKPKYAEEISNLVGAFKYRHWLAHGRYWTPKLGQRYGYHDLYLLADGISYQFPFEVV